MPVFAYRAVRTRAGERAPSRSAASSLADQGVVVADSARAARDVLRGRGLLVEQVIEQRATDKASRLPGRRWGSRFGSQSGSRISPARVTALLRELSTLLGVGMPLAEALDLLSTQDPGTPPSALALRLAERVRGGRSLAQAMRDEPANFDSLALNLVEVGESSGTLESSIARLAEFRERSLGLKNRVVTSLMYPAIVLTMALLVSVLLMTVVVPNLLSALQDAGRTLPWPTRVVKGVSDLLVSYWWALGLGLFAGVAGIRNALRTATGRAAWDRIQLRLPLLGPLLRKQAMVRVAVVMSTLLKSGVVFVRALEIAAETSGNRVIGDALREAAARVTEGREIGPALARAGAGNGATPGVFPPVVVQVFATGQQSGRLEEMLDRLAIDYDAAVAQATARLTALLEPALILVLVGVVGLIGFATVLPMLEAADAF